MPNMSSIFRSGWRTALAAAVAIGAASFLMLRPPATAQASAPQTRAMGAPAADYVSSDPSLPPAAGVKFPEPGPHIEAF